MKKRFSLCCAAALLLSLLGGCVVNVGDLSGKTVRGKGAVISKEYEVSAITQISTRGSMELIYRIGEPALTIEGRENLFDYLYVDETGGLLTIREELTIVDTSVKVYITSPSLTKADLDGATVFTDADLITAESFDLSIGGAASVTLALETDAVAAKSAGAGRLEFSGRADRAEFTISGAGALDAYALQTVTAKVKITGAGSAYVNCSGTLDVTITGAGNCEYKGGATVNPSINGLGSVRRAD